MHFEGIYQCVREALVLEIGRLGERYLRANKDLAVKAELDRLNAELENLPEGWVFRGR